MVRHPSLPGLLATLTLLAGCGGGGGGSGQNIAPDAPPKISRSSALQLAADGQRVFIINKVASPDLDSANGSLSIVRVRDLTGDRREVLDEIEVGRDPWSVSLNEAGDRAFVTNGADNTVSVIDLGFRGTGPYRAVTDIVVGSEPRGTAIVGDRLYVANYSDGSLTVIDTESLLVVGTISLASGGRRIRHPFGVIGIEGRELWVTDFFAQAAPGRSMDAIEGFDSGKVGRVAVVSPDTANVQSILELSPLADSGFTADRTAFDTANGAVNDTFKAPDGVDPTAVPQGVYFNQLAGFSYDVQNERLYLPAIGAQPAPPVRFNVNVQSLVGVLDTSPRTERPDLHFNVNALIRANFDVEEEPAVPFVSREPRLDRAFFADISAMDVVGRSMAMVSRAGSYMILGEIADSGSVTLARDTRDAILRIPTTNLPSGVVMSSDGERAYVASDLVGELSVIDIVNGVEVARIQTAASPDGKARRELLGKLAFFTGMGMAADTDSSTDPRSVDTHRFRNMASDNNWSSCASCHPSGLADGATWIFPTGPRQTIALDAFFAPGSTTESDLQTTDQKVSNWNGVRGSITDFNNNSRNVQGGFGFTPLALNAIDQGGEPGDVLDAGLVSNHGPRLSVSNALDFMTEWVASIRVFNRPSELDQAAVDRGRNVFAVSCASCHGGTKWTTATRVLDLARWPDPAFVNGAPATPNLFNPAATVVTAFDSDDDLNFETLLVQAAVGAETLDLQNPIEIRGLGGAIGQASAGAGASFVPPSLFNVVNTSPYGHHGRAQSLEAVFDTIATGGLGHPTFGIPATELSDVLEFVRAIDAAQPTIR